MSNIESINKSKTSSMDWTVVDTLRSLLNDLERGDVKYNKCFICLLDSQDDRYSTGFRMAKMIGSEAVALLDITKHDLLNAINRESNMFED